MEQKGREILGTPITEPIEYWKKYWSHYVGKLSEKDNSGAILDSPHILIDTIISEIEYNDLRNTENRKYFIESLGIYKKKDPVFEALYGQKVKLLINSLNHPECAGYASSICKHIIEDMETGHYFDHLVSYLLDLIEHIQKFSYQEKKKIDTCTELIVAEFVSKGFWIEDINNIIDKELNVFFDASGNIVYAENTYKNLKKEDFETEQLYYNAISELIANKSVADRVWAIKDYFYIEPRDCYAIIRLEGIKGKDVDYMIGDINIYSPHKKQYIENDTISHIEKIPFDKNYLNVAIPIKHKMIYSSINQAIEKLNKVLDLIGITYETSQNVSYSEQDASIVENGHCLSSLHLTTGDEEATRRRQMFVKYMLSWDITTEKKQIEAITPKMSLISNGNRDSKKLLRAIHWYQKGRNVKSAEDKLLFHWIALESVLKSSESIYNSIVGKKDSRLLDCMQKICAAILAKSFFRNNCVNMYINLNDLTQNWNNYYDLPADLIEKAGLNMKEGDKIHVNKFFNNLQSIEESLNSEIQKTIIHELGEFYKDVSGIKQEEKEIKDIILLAYRLRNFIAHNAVYPRYIINHYANQLQGICSVVLWHLMEAYRTLNMSLDEICVDISTKYDEFILNIDDEIEKLKAS